jgi:hypothetical protein
MKKNVKLMCVALIFSATAIAQQAAKTIAATTKTAVAEKITFPPNCFTSQSSKALKVDKIVWPMGGRVVTVLGTTETGIILENEKGEKMLLSTDHTITPIVPQERLRVWQLMAQQSSSQLKVKLIGTTDTGEAVWERVDGKGNCTLDKKGNRVDYIGHVTLLK